jgi:hypothetical protein
MRLFQERNPGITQDLPVFCELYDYLLFTYKFKENVPNWNFSIYSFFAA